MPESDNDVGSISATSQMISNSRPIFSTADSKETYLSDAKNSKLMVSHQKASSPSLSSTSTSSINSIPLSYCQLNTVPTTVITAPKTHEMTSEDIVASRHLGKLKRFLTTLQKFSYGISAEVGEQVKRLITDVVTKSLTVEEFNQIVSQVTNFPLRPFVVPFLKSSLPYLQRQLSQMAHLMKMTPRQYLYQNEFLVMDGQPTNRSDALDIFNSELNENGKRKLSIDRRKSMDFHETIQEGQSPPKRQMPLIIQTSSQHQRFSPIAPISTSSNHPLFQIDEVPRDMRRERLVTDPRNLPGRDTATVEQDKDEWKNIYTMLNCILGMVDKTKKALAILQERNSGLIYPEGDPNNAFTWNTHNPTISPSLRDSKTMKIGSIINESQFMAPSSDDPVYDHQAEEVLKDLKIQAVVDLQRAVTAAETKANKIVAAERVKMEKILEEAKLQAAETALLMANKQQESSESCWNCGRKASETCSGCNTARYCGSFCQHKDWENHHKVCGKMLSTAQKTAANPSSSSSSPPVNVTSSSHQNISDDEADKKDKN